VKQLARRSKKSPRRSSQAKEAQDIRVADDHFADGSAISTLADAVLTVGSTSGSAKYVTHNLENSPSGAPARQSDENSINSATDRIADVLIGADVFDEEGYLRLNPDVRHAIEFGQIQSAYSHYVLYGKVEGRPLPDTPKEIRNVMLRAIVSGQSDVSPIQARCCIDALLVAPNGGLMLVGWIDDAAQPVSCIRVVSSGWRVVIDASRLVRVRRTDVEKSIGSRTQHAFGFIGFLHFDRGGEVLGPITIELWQKAGTATALQFAATLVRAIELRDTALAHLASASFFGNSIVESMVHLERGVGAELVALNKIITQGIVASPYVEQFAPRRKSPRGTIVVCLYGKPEFYFLQNCLFSGLPGIDDYEFVYVSNSPEMAEALLREARSASLIYGLTNSVMILSGNAGFGGANNAATKIARSDRLVVVNPDVFPRDPDWARKHTYLLDTGSPAETRLFGVPLYYDDGSLMHSGMYFEIDAGLSLTGGAPTAQQICRVEHYGKGAPAESPQFTRPRPVPAVTGAFMSVDKSWFEELGGFTEDFIYGHYEDADLCLKSIEKGVVPWLQDIRMWHLEGKGSTRQLPHEGGSLINRWLFSQRWLRVIETGLKGSAPSHRLLQAADSVGASSSASIARPDR
jgi:GT2 family glycosyltransferase